ncbi:MAG: cation diffusion facilitator family transporter [Bacteroidota bacterium]
MNDKDSQDQPQEGIDHIHSTRTRAAFITLAANIFLFCIKLYAGLAISSISVISEAFNSLLDIIASGGIIYSVWIALRAPDEDHPFGHRAAEPITSLLYTIFAGVVCFNMLKESIERVFTPTIHSIHILPFAVLAVTIIIKFAMGKHLQKVGLKYESPALMASSIDAKNDVLCASMAIVGITLSYFGYTWCDGIGGIAVSLMIARGGYLIAKENINYLMGKGAGEELMLKIIRRATKIEGVLGVNALRSHHVGNRFHIEIHIEVDRTLATQRSHDIGKEVQNEIESLREVNKVFVHIDPVEGRK